MQGLGGGLGMGVNSAGLRASGTGLGMGRGTGGLGMGGGTGIGMGGGTGIGMGGGSGLGMGRGTGLGMGGASGLGMGASGYGTTAKPGIGMGTGAGLGMGTGTGLGMGTGTGLGMGTGTGLGMGTGTGLGMGGLGMGTGMGGLQTSSAGLGMGLGQHQTGLASTGMGLSGNRLGMGGVSSAGMGMGGVGTGLGTSMGGGMRPMGNTGSALGGLSLAGTQRGATQGIFTQSGLPQPPSQQQLLQSQLMLSAITMPALFGDERDTIVQKFNQLEAYCGTGKGLTNYGGQLQAVDFTPHNPFARFKTLCYNRLPNSKNEDGLVGLQFKRPETELMAQKDSLGQSLQAVINNTSVQVIIDSIKPLPDNCAEVTIYLLEQSAISVRRVLATNTCMYLQSQQRKAQLDTLGVTGIYPKTGIGEEELKMYLSTPPNGITSQVWEQSKKENPDAQKFIPIAVIGSGELLKRIKHQKQECHQHNQRLQLISDELSKINQQLLISLAKIAEHRRKLNDFSHRILRVMVLQEKVRKSGWSIQPVEEQLRVSLDGLHRELDSSPLKGKLNEIMSQVRMHSQHYSSSASSTHSHRDNLLLMDPIVADEINEHLFQQQGALTEMVKILKQDFQDLSLLEDGLKELA